MAVQIEVRDEHTRWTLQIAALHVGISQMAGLDEDCWVAWDQGDAEYEAARVEAMRRLAWLTNNLALAETVRAARVGDLVEIPDHLFVRQMDDLRDYGDHYDYGDGPRSDRMRWVRDRLATLEAQLAEAVA